MSNIIQPSPATISPSSETVNVVDLSRLNRSAGVCGGSICVRNTRVPVWVLERCRQLRISLPEILEDYPFLDGDDVAAAWRYADAHQEEMQREIQEHQD